MSGAADEAPDAPGKDDAAGSAAAHGAMANPGGTSVEATGPKADEATGMPERPRAGQALLMHPMKRLPAPVRQATLQTNEVVRHLLFHKALVDEDDAGEKLGGYIGMVLGSSEGEHVSIRDPFHRDLAIAFELVIQNHLDPWNLDLSKFAQLYLREARQHGVDLVTAGRIILMAWTVLKLQSDDVADRAMQAQQQEELGWSDVPDFSFSDDEWDYTQRIQALPRAPIDEKIRHKGDRRVTLMELIHAFEEVHHEAQERLVLQQQKLQARLSLRRRMRGRVGGMMHKEDLEAEIHETWQRVLDHPKHPIPFRDLVEPDPMDVVQTFNALLFLVKQGRCTVSQEDFPYGEIWISPSLPEAKALIEEEPTP